MNKRNLVWVYIACGVLSLFFLFPIFWIVLSSFKDGSELFRYPPTLFPESPTIGNYILALQKGNFTLFFKNSTAVAVLSTIVTVIINTMAGYAFAKYTFKGRDIIFIFFISTLMLPLEVLMIPIFQVVKYLGMYNSFVGIIIPPAATPAGVFLLRQYFLSVPDDLIEAARIDGASETGIFIRLMIPIAKPAMSVLAIFSFMWRWNDFMWPLLVIRDTEKYTLQLALSNFNGQYSVDWNSLIAMSVVTMIPVLIVFLIFQRQFIQGMMTSGMKE
jgi:alpha-1,4-digalacturonate transport system permease protein